MYFSIICGAFSDIFNYLVSILFFNFGSLSPPYFSTLAFQPGSAHKTPGVKTERNKGGKQHKQTHQRKNGGRKDGKKTRLVIISKNFPPWFFWGIDTNSDFTSASKHLQHFHVSFASPCR